MNSLFAKILIWFLVTSAVAIIGFGVLTTVSFTASEWREAPFARSSTFLLEEARRAYESGGPAGLRAFLDRVQSSYQGEAVLADAGGHDVLTGKDESGMLAGLRRRWFFPVTRGDQILMARRSDDGRYWFFLLIPRHRVSGWFLHPQYLWVLAAVIALCWALARYLTRPLRQTQAAIERFGRGDFSVRTRSRRRDELGELARTFDRMAEQIELLRQAERRLLLDVSHELRSPLARLGVAIELARSGEDQEAALDRLRKESERLNSLVEELLQVTRAECDPSALRAAPLRLDEVVAELVDDCRVEARARDCSIELRTPEPVVVPGDRELLRRAVENVVRNAIRYAPPKTAVEVAVANAPAAAVVSVRDSGPGVPAEALGNIFDPFYRVDADRNRSTGGAGLGLAIARRAIELHKGQVRASNAQPGLLVEIRLPANGRERPET